MSPTASGFAPINGLQMYYEIYGSGKPIVLIHGGGSTIKSWTRLIPLLSSSRQVIAVEMQAHGRTQDIDRDFTFEQDADDIAALVKYFNLPKADIYGFSNGGQTALQVAIRHPKVVDHLIVASIGYKREGFQPWFWSMMNDASFENMPQALKDEFLKVNPNEKALFKMYERDAHRMQTFKGWTDDLIKTIKAPTLIMAGDNDVITPEHAIEMFRLISKSRLSIFPDGHGYYMSEASINNGNPKLHEAVANVVLDFLEATD